MPDIDKIKPNFEEEVKITHLEVDNKKCYEKVIPDMIKLINENKEEIEKAKEDISSEAKRNVSKQ